jgi:hypothetical protein
MQEAIKACKKIKEWLEDMENVSSSTRSEASALADRLRLYHARLAGMDRSYSKVAEHCLLLSAVMEDIVSGQVGGTESTLRDLISSAKDLCDYLDDSVLAERGALTPLAQ